VTAGSLERYLARLRRELRRRWLDDDRFVEEAREHLVDRIEDGVQRGLSRDAAEQDALRGFGSPEAIADCAAAERYPMWNRWGVFAVIWDRKWWIVVPTIATAVLAIIASPYVVPVRYRSEAFIELRQLSSDTPPGRSPAQLQVMSQSLTGTRLERIIQDLNLYERERKSASLDSVALRMRHDITLVAMEQKDGPRVQNFVVRFTAPDPHVAQRGAERLASLFVDENFRGWGGIGGIRPDTQLKIVEPPKAPEQPLGPSPTQLGALGGSTGLVAGIALISILHRRRNLRATSTLL
jgi:HAAS/Chain length determinant protein